MPTLRAPDRRLARLELDVEEVAEVPEELALLRVRALVLLEALLLPPQLLRQRLLQWS
jgi:hypothetical protein